jgi:alanine dehydrogenase
VKKGLRVDRNNSNSADQYVTLEAVLERIVFFNEENGFTVARLQVPKAYLLVEDGDFRAMPAALPGCAGMKWVNAHPQNPSRNLPSVMAVMVYNDPETGYPLAIMDATKITAYRTGAAAAIASKYLARIDSQTIGIIGAGRQAYTQILAHAELFEFRSINVRDLYHR